MTRSRGKSTEEKLTLNKRVNFSTFINIKPSGGGRVRHVERTSQKQKRLTELDLHFDNIKTLVRCSNATPIRCKVGDRYACGYCLDQYMDPRELKKHTLNKHRDSDDKLECLNIRSLSRYSVHLDITNLKCTICNDSINRLEELIEHLKLEHDEPIHSHIRNLMVPYKFESLQLSCAICLQEFDEYSDLQEHMTEHYRNYVCEFCDKAFIMRSVMVDHKKNVHRRSSRSRKTVIKVGTGSTVRLKMTKRKEVHKHQENIACIILSSNATPIKSWSGFGYTCSFCALEFPEPSELKKHTLNTHNNEDKAMYMVGCSLSSFIVKLDITDLQCKLCSISIESLDDLENHLTSAHGKVFHKDIKSHVVPFRFHGDDYRCVLCKNEYNNFKVLLEHMNRHFRNYLCKECDNGFVNQRMLQTHSYRHKKGVFICPQCSKVFDNKVKQKEHERAVHVSHNMRSKCGYCGEKFSDYTKKNDHMVKVHGAKALVLKCQACNKSFDNQRSLTVHTKSYHLLEGRLKK